MDSKDLKYAHWKTLAEMFGRMKGALYRVVRQMDELKLHPADPLRPKVTEVHDAAHRLWVYAHYEAINRLMFKKDETVATSLRDPAKNRSERLTPEEIMAVHDRVAALQEYLRRLTERMDALEFPEKDPLREATAAGTAGLNDFAAAVMRIAAKVEAVEVAKGLGVPRGGRPH